MKRITLLFVTVSIGFASVAQSLDEAKKLLRYGRLQGASKMFKQLVEATPADPEANYWLGQLYLSENPADIDAAKDLYTKATTTTNQNPLILVGMGHVKTMEGDTTGAKVLFEQAIAATKNRKNKQFGDPAILAAIGKANTTGDSKTGAVEYGLEKLMQAAQLQSNDPEVYIDMGLLYLKRGGGYGGQAKRAFEDAIEKNPKYGKGYWRIGKIFESQNNTEIFLNYFNQAVENDPNFARAYFDLYEYYKARDVNKAKSYLDKFMANNESDIETDFFYADFLFRSGKYQEAINKGKEMEAQLSSADEFPKLYRLYGVAHERLGDTVKAKQNLELYLAKQNVENLKGEDYADMAALYLKFPEEASKADILIEKAVALDTTVKGKMELMKSIADVYAAKNDAKGNYRWLRRIDDINPDKTAVTYFYLTKAALDAGEYKAAEEIATKYIDAYPDQIQGYSMLKIAAVSLDADTTAGTALYAIDKYNEFLKKDVAKNKNTIMVNYSYKVYYYLEKVAIPDYFKALDAVEGILEVDPENAYGLDAKAQLERVIKETGAKREDSSSNSAKTTGQAAQPTVPKK